MKSQLKRVQFATNLSFVFIFVLITSIAASFITYFLQRRNILKLIRKTEAKASMYKEYAMKDSLTGALSRLYFEIEMKQKNGDFVRDLRYPISVVMIDIDGFKEINDTYGHITGDRTLKYIVDVIKTNLAENDKVIRFGGDEFILLLSNCSEEKSDIIMRKINRIIQDYSRMGKLNISYGIQEVSIQEDLETAVNEADQKMYCNKKKKTTVI